MADAYQTRAQLVTDFADNSSGAITAQLLRDFVYSSIILNSSGVIDANSVTSIKMPASTTFDLNGNNVLNGGTVSFDAGNITSDGSGNLTVVGATIPLLNANLNANSHNLTGLGKIATAGNTASGTGSICIGGTGGSTASGNGSIAIGNQNTVAGVNSVAIGQDASISSAGTSSVVIATSNNANTITAANCLAIGQTNTVSSASSFCIGNTNTASGAGGTNFAIGTNCTVSGTAGFAMALGLYANASNQGAFAAGDNGNNTDATSLLASGQGSVVLGECSTGHTHTATGTGAVALGQDCNATANNALAIGNGINNSTAATVGVGPACIVYGKLGFALQPTDTFSGTMSIDVTKSSHVVSASHTTSATVTFNAAAAGTKGDFLEILTEADSSGTVTATFGTNFHSSGTQATTASTFSSIAFRSDGTRWIELYRTTALS